jgi:predicted GIY-YIG superfamily endonuclease
MNAVVYRCFDGDASLYVGATTNYVGRMATHSAQAEWFSQITRVDRTEHPTLEEAREVELDEIKRLRPRWNIVGRGPRSAWQLSDYAEVLLAIVGRRPFTFDPGSSDKRIERIRLEMIRRFPGSGADVAEDLDPLIQPMSDRELERWKTRRLNRFRASAAGKRATA